MVLDQIAGRRTELTGEVELLRKQLADAEHELDRLVIAEQVITQLTADAAGGEPPGEGPAQRGFGLLVPPRSQASGPGDLPGDYRSLLEAVALALLDHLSVERAVLAGMSQGGFLSLRAALTAPDRVRALVLIDSQAGLEDPAVAPGYEQMHQAWLEHGPGPVKEVVASVILSPGRWDGWYARWNEQYARWTPDDLGS
jgi:pimeloyl-ACP methyl ester carboxylesterase